MNNFMRIDKSTFWDAAREMLAYVLYLDEIAGLGTFGDVAVHVVGKR